MRSRSSASKVPAQCIVARFSPLPWKNSATGLPGAEASPAAQATTRSPVAGASWISSSGAGGGDGTGTPGAG